MIRLFRLANFIVFTLVLCTMLPCTANFTIGIELPNQSPVTPAVQESLRDMGIQYINYYVEPASKLGFGDSLPYRAHPDASLRESVDGRQLDFEQIGYVFGVLRHTSPDERPVFCRI